MIWEWADYSLDEWLRGDYYPESFADEIEKNLNDALDVLHGLDLVHLDVAPNNILRVGGVWKLADLDSCAPRGHPTLRIPLDPRWLHPDRREGGRIPARDEFDDYGLEQILKVVRDLDGQ